eukprot:1191391-Prorocentrum_minimum.AAC.2
MNTSVKEEDNNSRKGLQQGFWQQGLPAHQRAARTRLESIEPTPTHRAPRCHEAPCSPRVWYHSSDRLKPVSVVPRNRNREATLLVVDEETTATQYNSSRLLVILLLFRQEPILDNNVVHTIIRYRQRVILYTDSSRRAPAAAPSAQHAAPLPGTAHSLIHTEARAMTHSGATGSAVENGGNKNNAATASDDATVTSSDLLGISNNMQTPPCVLLTGGTGFVGKALLPLLLDSHPDAKVVLLIRKKRNQSAEQRRRALVHELFHSEDMSPEAFEQIDQRVRVVEGCNSDPTFWADEHVKSLTTELTHIINSAASVRVCATLMIIVRHQAGDV